VQTNANATRIISGTTVSVLYTAHLPDDASTVFDASHPPRRSSSP